MADDRMVFLRHTLATLAYRGGKALGGAPPRSLPAFALARPLALLLKS